MSTTLHLFMNTIAPGWNDETYTLPVGENVTLQGNLRIPPLAHGLVLFVHGGGSSRRSPRNQLVAHTLHDAGFATLLIDLLTAEEEEYDRYTGRWRFDIPMLGARVVDITRWLSIHPQTANLKIGYFGASTGVAAALVAAAEFPVLVRAIVSRGGRPDLASTALARVTTPTLLIVGSRDTPIIPLNQMAFGLLHGRKRIVFIEGATHLFREGDTLEQVAQIASQWFAFYLNGA